MEYLYGIYSEYFIYLWFLVVIGVVIFVHEYGHYIVGRMCSIHPEVFSIGMGKELFGWVDRRGTRWRIGLIPLGGYVKFLGDADPSSARADLARLGPLPDTLRSRSFHGAAVWKRALTIVAGPVFNFVLSVVVFTGLALWFGKAADSPVVGEVADLPGHEIGLKTGDRLLEVNGLRVERLGDLYRIAREMEKPGPMQVAVERNGLRMSLEIPYALPPLIGSVQPYGAAWHAGMLEGDLILTLNGQPVPSFDALRDVVLAAEGQELRTTYLRGAEVREAVLVPKIMDIPNAEGGFEKRVLIGVGIDYVAGPEVIHPGLLGAIADGADRTWGVVTTTVSGILHILSGDVSASNIQGPLGIAQLSGEMAKLGADRAIGWIALISTAIGLFNLLPIPVLDGGHLVFLGIEAVRGKPPAGRWVEFATTIGLALLVLVMFFATYNDVLRNLGLT